MNKYLNLIKEFISNKQKLLSIIFIIIATFLYIFTATIDLETDVINPDGINWHERTAAFTDGIYNKEYKQTYQAYHPGTTLMWISGSVLDVFIGDHLDNLAEQDKKLTFLERDYYAKLSVVLFTAIMFALTLIFLVRLTSLKFTALFSLFFIFEPFLLGTRRLYHLDYLM